LTVTLPPGLTAGTALDALTHAIEAFTCLRASPFTDSLALGAIELIGSHLRRVLADGRDLEARHNLLMAAAMAGMAMANAGLGLVHSISQPLGTRCRLPHGLSNAVLLPYVLEFNRTASPAKFARVAAALGKDPGGRDDLDASGMAVEAVEELLADAGLPRGLSELGVTKEVFPLLCEDALKGGGIRNNPRPAGKDDIAEILRQALG
ncbi:MAG: iron-containing alcohol dehydrogenase, partial [Firmicutes bacterium]|nr:iron-containing alcohol dehydrogenase [Bacillota bacterium]